MAHLTVEQVREMHQPTLMDQDQKPEKKRHPLGPKQRSGDPDKPAGGHASPESANYLRDLVARKMPDTDPEYTESVIDQGQRRVSEAISRLREMPDVGSNSAPAQSLRTNRYAANCENCDVRVEPEEGHLRKGDDGSWIVTHQPGKCPVTEFAFPHGRYAIRDGDEVKFYVATPKGLYVQASDDLYPVSHEPAEKIIEAIAENPREAAVLYGLELGVCGRCGKTLTSEWRKVGIGPVCNTIWNEQA